MLYSIGSWYAEWNSASTGLTGKTLIDVLRAWICQYFVVQIPDPLRELSCCETQADPENFTLAWTKICLSFFGPKRSPASCCSNSSAIMKCVVSFPQIWPDYSSLAIELNCIAFIIEFRRDIGVHLAHSGTKVGFGICNTFQTGACPATSCGMSFIGDFILL